ncbi:hypothetical protein NQ318_003492 [Aromia moschata]|uniref:Uncharacterized protein n=1 Tax=Aromia moschata TaxID=1265417 RepID=A0AAV8YW69_9CUCU|nr:hypothetical protein NQ318_003492 [Aromia moschata]
MTIFILFISTFFHPFFPPLFLPWDLMVTVKRIIRQSQFLQQGCRFVAVTSVVTIVLYYFRCTFTDICNTDGDEDTRNQHDTKQAKSLNNNRN